MIGVEKIRLHSVYQFRCENCGGVIISRERETVCPQCGVSVYVDWGGSRIGDAAIALVERLNAILSRASRRNGGVQ